MNPLAPLIEAAMGLRSLAEFLGPPGSEAPIAFNFLVVVDGYFYGDFLSAEIDAHEVPLFEVPHGGRNGSPPLRIGHDNPKRLNRVTLRKGNVVSQQMEDWFQAVRPGGKFRRNLAIYQLGRERLPFRIMYFHNAFPISWKAPTVDARAGNEVSAEELVFVYESFKMTLTRLSQYMELLDLSSWRDRVSTATEGVSDFVDTVSQSAQITATGVLDDALSFASVPDDFETLAEDMVAVAEDNRVFWEGMDERAAEMVEKHTGGAAGEGSSSATDDGGSASGTGEPDNAVGGGGAGAGAPEDEHVGDEDTAEATSSAAGPETKASEEDLADAVEESDSDGGGEST